MVYDESARLMGFEVIEDPSTEIDESPTDTPTTLDDPPTISGDTPTEEDNMDKPDKAVHWKTGDKAVIIGNHNHHKFVMGETVELISYWSFSAWDCKNADGHIWTVREEDMRPFAEKEKEADKDTNFPVKPRLAEVLGVEVGEKFTFPYPNRAYDRVFVDSDGILREQDTATGNVHRLGSRATCWLINHPESIIHAPRLTETELAICRGVNARWVSMDNVGINVDLWAEEPVRNNKIFRPSHESDGAIACIRSYLFPSVRPGDCINVEEAI